MPSPLSPSLDIAEGWSGGMGTEKIPWYSSRATAESQGTAERRSTVLETSWSFFLPKIATKRSL